VWESGTMRALGGLGMTLGYVGTLLVTAARRPFRPPPRPSWSIGDEARAVFLRRFLRRVHAMPVEVRRRTMDSVPVLLPGAMLRTRRRRDSLAGVPVTWITPRVGAEPRLIVYAHGGGFTFGSSRMIRDLLARLALAGRARVLSVDYRLAPEHPWPAALEDLRAVWQSAQAEYAPKQVVFAGDSAGANLALALLLELRDRREALPAGALLLSPWVDLASTSASFEINAEIDIVFRDAMLRSAADYAASGDPSRPSLSPLRAELAGLPPLYLQAGGAEVLRGDAEALAARARAAGVPAALDVFDDQVHDFQTFGALSRTSLDAIARAGEAVQVFAPVPKMART
jgi:epsilon-lactone hydrolase